MKCDNETKTIFNVHTNGCITIIDALNLYWLKTIKTELKFGLQDVAYSLGRDFVLVNSVKGVVAYPIEEIGERHSRNNKQGFRVTQRSGGKICCCKCCIKCCSWKCWISTMTIIVVFVAIAVGLIQQNSSSSLP